MRYVTTMGGEGEAVSPFAGLMMFPFLLEVLST